MMTNRGTFARVRQTALQGTALAMLGIGGPALVQTLPQSYNAGIPTVSSGSIGTQFGSANETIFINSSTAVLNWTPNDQTSGTTPINFQNAQTSMTYQGIAGNFTVLNRIVPTGNATGRAISFNGTVNSVVGQVTGGSVWFYSPGGIFVSNTGQFNVGNLLLTARDPIGGGTTINDPNTFAGGGTGEAGIVLNPGAQINALMENSYVALVAPRIFVDAGASMRVNGQNALVGAEQAQLTINNGLFDIVYTTGSSANNGFPVIVRGTIGGPASTGATDPHAIYVVAVPKNVAATALIEGTGNIGFDIATDASITNGKVVLSNGSNINQGLPNQLVLTAPALGDTNIGGGNFTSDVTLNATRTAYVYGTATNTPQFSRDLSLTAPTAQVGSFQPNTTLNVGRDLSIGGVPTSVTSQAGITTVTGATSRLFTSGGGRIQVGGNLNMFSSASVSGNGTQTFVLNGGNADITTGGGGFIRVLGSTTMAADAIDQSTNTPGLGATTTGGNLYIYADSGDILLDGTLYASALAKAATSRSTTAATSHGGAVYIRTAAAPNTGRVVVGAAATLDVTAIADRTTLTGGVSGNAIGGIAQAQIRGSAFNVGGTFLANSSAYTDDTLTGFNRPAALAGTTGGNATGGTSQVLVDGANSTFAQLNLQAIGFADANTGGGNGVGGAGTGGVSALVSTAGSLTVSGLINFNSGGRGGNKTGGVTGGGGAGVGGQGLIRTTAGVINVGGQLFIQANGTGGSSTGTGVSGFGGSGTGGGARIDTPVAATGTITVAGGTTLNAGGTGGNATVTTGQTGGAGIGGTGTSATNFQRGTYIVNQGGTFTLAGVTMNANGLGGSGAIGGAATGGLSQLSSFGGTVSVSGTTVIAANATGGTALAAGNVGGGTGGAATAGTARASADYINQQSTVTNQRVTLGATTINAIATGGAGAAGVNAGAGGVGGAAIGGIAQAFSNASTLGITTTSMSSDTRGFGGAGGAGGTGVGGAGGAGQGGQTGGIGFGTISGPELPPNTGLASFGNTTILASGSGGAGGSGSTGGAGGLGYGGYTTILSRGTPVTFGTLNFSGQGIGGAGGSGTTAQGQGGSAVGGGLSFATTNRYLRSERGLLVAGNTFISTSGLAGPGAPGATATAGWTGMGVTNGDVTFGTFNYQSLGTLPSTDNVPAFTIDVTGGVFGTSGLMTVDSTGNAVLSARDGGVISAAQMNLTVRGDVLPRPTETPVGVLGTIATNGSLTLNADNVSLQSNIVAGGSLSLHGGTVQLANVTTGSFADIGADNLTVGNIASANADVTLHTMETNVPTRQVTTGTITAPGGSIFIDSGGSITTGALFAGSDIYATAVGALIINGSAIANALGTAPNDESTDGGLVLFSSDGAISTGNLTALFVQIQQGELNDNFTPATTPAQVTVGNVNAERIVIDGIGNVTTGVLTVSNVYQYLTLDPAEYPVALLFAGALGDLNVASATGTDFGLLAAGNNLTTGNLNFTGSVAVTAGQNATLGTVTTGTGANDLFYAANTSVLFNDPLIAPHFLDLLELSDSSPSTPFSPSLLLTSTLPAMGGALSVGNLTTGTARAAASSATFAGINASQRFILTVSGLASFNGLATSPRFDITSGDIAIGTNATIGTQSTAILNLNALGTLITVGGDNGSEGYFLSSAEAGRLTAGLTTIATQGSVMLRSLTLRGSASQQPNLVGQQATFRIGATGAIRVEGAITITGAAATDNFLLSSNQRIEVPTDLGGSIALNGQQTSSLSGVLSLAAPVIAVASNNIIAQMAQDPRYAGRDAALATPSGNRPEGFLQAGRIGLTAGNVIAIQNSNTAATMGGFTSGSGGITVFIPTNQQQTAAPVDVRIYGRTTSATGAFVTNGDTLATVTRTPNSGTFSTVSAVNGCLFTATVCAPPAPPPVDPGPNEPVPPGPNNPSNPNEPVPISPTVVALVNEATDGEPVLAATVPAIRIVKMLDETAIVEDAEVTDPVAGSANASVWDVGTDDNDDADTDSAGADATPAAPGAGGGK